MAQSGGGQPDLDLTLRRFWRLLEFTRDIDRNEDDGSFARAGGRISYVFDENLFELFISPLEQSRYVELFHSTLWQDGLPPSEMRRISAQSALVTAEYLFSGKLTGQLDGTIYMTEWHFRELSYRRVQHIQAFKDLLENLDNGRDTDTLMEDLTSNHDEDDLTKIDIQEFAETTHDRAAIERFRETRLAVRSLASRDWTLGPVHQLKRIGSKDIAGRVVPLAAAYRPTARERLQLIAERRRWLDLLQEENQKRNREGTRRPSASLQNDADALTYVAWVARHRAGKGERFVFVTGDTLIFDVYRAWHIDQPAGEPFILRRVSQYAPIISLNDAPTDVVNRPELFHSTREALEAALFIFNLSGFEKDTVQFHSGREHLALNLLRYHSGRPDGAFAETFISRLTAEWIERRNQDFIRLVSLWQKFERFVLGINYDLIMRRSGERVPRRPGPRATISTDGGAYVEYLRGLLDELVSGSIQLFFPFASTFISSVVNDEIAPRYERLERVPIALRLCIPNGSGSDQTVTDFSALLQAWRQGDPAAVAALDVARNPSLVKRPDLVYAIAAALAFASGEWRDAERFSDLARSAEPITELSLADKEDSRFECLYLYAVSKRFRLATLDPRQSGAREDIWHRLLDSAVRALTKCELHHARKGEIRRQVRAISERAAVRLFYSCWGAVTPIEELQARQYEITEAVTQLQASIDDLRRCLELEPNGEKMDTLDTRRRQFFDRIKLQYVTNMAAAHLLVGMFRDVSGQQDLKDISVGERGVVLERIEEFEVSGVLEKRHLLARVVLLAFRAREIGAPRGSVSYEAPDRWSIRPTRSRLALDNALVDAIQGMMDKARHSA